MGRSEEMDGCYRESLQWEEHESVWESLSDTWLKNFIFILFHQTVVAKKNTDTYIHIYTHTYKDIFWELCRNREAGITTTQKKHWLDLTWLRASATEAESLRAGSPHSDRSVYIDLCLQQFCSFVLSYPRIRTVLVDFVQPFFIRSTAWSVSIFPKKY